MVENGGQLDNSVDIVTPENIAFRYRVAGPFRRLPAYLIDVGIRLGVLIGAAVALTIASGFTGLGQVGAGLWLVTWFGLEWFYGGLFEAYWNGQTPGKRLLRLRVLTVDGQPVSGWQAVLRNLLRAIDCQPMAFHLVGVYMLAFGAAAGNRRFQRLGDLAAGTMVVIEEPHWFRGVLRLQEPEVLRLASQLPASFQATRSLARTLAAYVQRRPYFVPVRRIEMARYLADPLRERFGLPAGINPDLLLCALYHRIFVTNRADEAAVEDRKRLNPEPRTLSPS